MPVMLSRNVQADLDSVKANAAGRDFVQMGDARKPEHNTERSILALAAAMAFPVEAVEQEARKRRVHESAWGACGEP